MHARVAAVRRAVAAVVACTMLACAESPDTVADDAASDDTVAGSAPLDSGDAGDTAVGGSEGWTIGAHAAGPLRIGMTAAAAGAALGVKSTGAGPSPECRMMPVPNAPAGMWLMFVGDTLVRFDVSEREPHTAAGVGVGSTEAEVQAAYGARMVRTPHKYAPEIGHYLIVASESDASHATVFETDGERVTRYRAGRRPQVEWVEGCA